MLLNFDTINLVKMVMSNNKYIKFIKDNWYWSLYVISFICFCVRNTEMDNDCFFLLNNGRYVLRYGIPHIDPFTIHSGLHYVMQQWLFSIILYSFYKLLGKYGLFTFNIILYFLIIFVLYKLCRLFIKNKLVVVLITSIIGFAITPYIVLRPQSVTYLILLLETYFLEKYVKTNNYKYLIVLPVLSIILINFHASMWYFIFIFMLPFLVNSIKIKKLTIDKVNLKPLLIVMFIMFIVGFINPYGIEAITYILKSYGLTEVNNFVSEMENPINLSNYYLILNTLLLLLVLFILIVFKKSKLDIRFYCFLIGLFVLNLLHYKTEVYFILWYAYIFCYLIKDLKLKYKIKDNIIIKILNELKLETSLILCITFILVLFFSYKSYNMDVSYINNIVHYMEDNYNKKDVILFVDYNDGGYTEYLGYKSYIDPRAELFYKKMNGKKDIFIELSSMLNNEPDFSYDGFLKKYNFTHIIVPKHLGLYYYLEDNNVNYTYEYGQNAYDEDFQPYFKLYVRNDISISYKLKRILSD